MRKSIYTLALILGALGVKAQNTDTTKMHGWFMHNIAGAAQIQVTYRKSDLSHLNHALNNDGIPSVGENDIWINLSMSHIYKKWIWEDGLGFTPFSNTDVTNVNNIQLRYNQYQAYFRLAYNLSNNSSYRFYPFAGVNFSGAVLNEQDNTGEQRVTSFSSEVANATYSKTLYQPNFGVELGAGFDYVIKLKPKTMDCVTIQRNIPVGIRAGYYLNTYSGAWHVDDYTLDTGPHNHQSAVFVSLNIGLGYGISRQ